MKESGFAVTESVPIDLQIIKDRYQIPGQLRDCHTAVVGKYFIEGHVPPEAVHRLLAEQPDIAGLALPGMPQGSPGMSGVKRGPFVVLQVNHDGSVTEFGSY